MHREKRGGRDEGRKRESKFKEEQEKENVQCLQIASFTLVVRNKKRRNFQ